MNMFHSLLLLTEKNFVPLLFQVVQKSAHISRERIPT